MIDTKAIRKTVLDLAIQGKLTNHDDNESSVDDIHNIRIEKERLITDKIIKKPKTLKPISEEEKVFEIPSNWNWIRLDELCKMVTDGTHKTPNYQKDGVPFLSVKNISSGNFDLSDVKYISNEEHRELIKRCNPEKDDILICRIGTLGKAITISIDLEFSIFVSLGLLKPIYSSLSEYIVRVINSGYGMEWIQSNKAGGAMHTYKINLDSLRMLPVPFPPISEQYRIVAQVDEIFKQLDIIDKLRQKYSSDFEILKSKIIEAGIQGKLTEQLPEDGTAEELFAEIQEEKAKLIKEKKIKKEKALAEISDEEIPFEIPCNWKWVRMSEILDVRDGTHDSPRYYEDGIPMITSKNLSTGVLDFGNVKYVSEEDAKKINERSAVDDGDVLFAMIGTIGNPVLVKKEQEFVVKNVALFKKYEKTNILMEYIYWYLMREQNEFKKIVSGGLQPFISLKQFRAHVMPLPPLKEQERIVERMNKLFSQI